MSPFGYAVLSKEKLKILKVDMPEDFIYVSNEKICFSLVYLMPQISKEGKKIRDNIVSRLITKMNQCNSKISFIAGDFNATLWSSPLIQLKSHGFKSGTHVFPTWPTFFYEFLGIPMDHVLIRNNLSFSRYNIINPQNGSDHYALIMEIK